MSRRLALLAVPCLALWMLAPPVEAQALGGEVFAGTWGHVSSGEGRVYRYVDGTTWEDLSPPAGLGDAVWDLEWIDGELWVGTHEGHAAYVPIGGTRPDERPHGFRGRVLRYDGTTWTDMSIPGGFRSAVTTVSLVDGQVFITVDRRGLYRWEGFNNWTLVDSFIMAGQAVVSDSHDGRPLLYIGQDNIDEFWVHDPAGVLACGNPLADPSSDTDDCQIPSGNVCSADCWLGSCIHALTEFDDGSGPLVYGGAYQGQMYRWNPLTRLFTRIEPVPPGGGPFGQPRHVQGLASFQRRLWAGLSDGKLYSSSDATTATYELAHDFGTAQPISDLYTDSVDGLLWVGLGAVPFRWAQNSGVSGIYTFDGVRAVERGLSGQFGEGVLQLLVVEPEIVCDAGDEQTVECTGGGAGTPVQLDGSASEIAPALDPAETVFTWTGGFEGGVAEGETVTVLFPGPGDYTVTLTVTSGAASATCETLVHVVDTEAPGLPTRDGCLWPPNHRYRCYTVADFVDTESGTAWDDCDGEVEVRITSVSSSQPEEELPGGDGRTRGDILWDEDHICVRAERLGDEPAGRDYTIQLESVDSSGNVSVAEAVLHVPHDQRPGSRCGERPVDPGLRPIDDLPLRPDPFEGSYPAPRRERSSLRR